MRPTPGTRRRPPPTTTTAGTRQPRTAPGLGNNSSSNNTNRDRQPQRNKTDKARIIKKTQKLDAKLADWSDDEDYGAAAAAAEARGSKWDKLVILRHMFTLAELDEDPAALLDIKEDIREECAKLGDVTNVVLYDLEESGVVSVKFRRADAAEACVRLMDGRSFDGRIVEAAVATGRDRFRKSKKNDNDEKDSDDGEDAE